MIIYTSICANYAHKARTLAKSVKAHITDAKFIVCLVEREIDARMQNDDCFDEIILAKDAWNGNFDRFIFKHSIVEASTAVKGQFLRFLMENYPDEDKFVYLDPDVYVYGDFIELKEEMNRHPIILCPHLLNPGNIDMELSSTAHGVYNLGFLAITRSEEGCRCVNWWAERLYLFCYDDIARGIFTDQKWFDLVPCFFDAKVFKHHGYDFAPWALWGCSIQKVGSNYIVNGDSLRFIHFSGLGATAESCMQKWLPEEGKLFRTLYQDYVVEHNQNDMDQISKTSWSYATFRSGEIIDDTVRAVYRGNYDVMFMYEDPFAFSNGFYRKLLCIDKKGKHLPADSFRMLLLKSTQVLESEGFGALIHKAFHWLRKKITKSE